MRFKKIEIILNILFWVLTSWMIISSSSNEVLGVEIIDGEKVKTTIRNWDMAWSAAIGQVFYVLLFYGQLFLINRLAKSKKIVAFVLLSIFLILLIEALGSITIEFIVFPEMADYKSSFSSSIFYFVVAISYGFIKMWLKNEKERSQLELVKNQAELNLLRLQLQPHFLFNTMNNLLSMVNQSDNPKLAQSIDKLSGLLRYVVYETKNDQVLIKDEISFIKNFADLHLLRFEENEIDFDISVLGTNDQQRVEPGIFLCYVENAFKHGVQPEEKAFIHISIDLIDPLKIRFCIENSLPKQPPINEAGGFGIESNNERLNLAYPNRHSISINKTETFSVDLTIEQ